MTADVILRNCFRTDGTVTAVTELEGEEEGGSMDEESQEEEED